jgi:TctA family transporter
MSIQGQRLRSPSISADQTSFFEFSRGPGEGSLGRPDIIFGIFVAMLVTNIFLLALSIIAVRMSLQLNRLP